MRSYSQVCKQSPRLPKIRFWFPRGKQSRRGWEAAGSSVSVTRWKHRFYRWRVRWIENGKREDKGFKKKAEAEGGLRRRKWNYSIGTGVALTSEERAAVINSRESLEAAGITLREAVRIALDIRKKELRSITVGELVQRVTADRESARKRWTLFTGSPLAFGEIREGFRLPIRRLDHPGGNH